MKCNWNFTCAVTALHVKQRKTYMQALTKIQVVSYNFQCLIVEKLNKARQHHSSGQKHNFPVSKRIFKWYHSMVRCKSYGPLSDEW